MYSLGVSSNNGRQWQHDRKFLLNYFRNSVTDKSSLETAVLTEAEALVNDLKLCDGKPIKFPNSLENAPLNVIWQMVAGKNKITYIIFSLIVPTFTDK